MEKNAIKRIVNKDIKEINKQNLKCSWNLY